MESKLVGLPNYHSPQLEPGRIPRSKWVAKLFHTRSDRWRHTQNHAVLLTRLRAEDISYLGTISEKSSRSNLLPKFVTEVKNTLQAFEVTVFDNEELVHGDSGASLHSKSTLNMQSG